MLLAVVCIGFGVASYRTSANAIEKRVNESLPQIAEDAGKLINARLAVYFVGIDTAANRLVIRSMDWSKQLPAIKEEMDARVSWKWALPRPTAKLATPMALQLNLATEITLKAPWQAKWLCLMWLSAG